MSTGGITRTRKNPAKKSSKRTGFPENMSGTVSGAWIDPFFRVPNELIDHPEEEPKLSTVETLVYLVLCRYANKDGQAWPRYQRIADGARCSRRSAIRAVARLEEAGLLLKSHVFSPTGEYTSNHYVVYLPSQVRAARAEAELKRLDEGQNEGGRCHSVTAQCQDVTARCQSGTYIEEEDILKEQEKKRALSASTEDRKAKAKALPPAVRASLERLYERMKDEGRQSTLDDVLSPEPTK